MFIKESFLAVGLLAGTIIGAGIFSLPYIFSQIGLATGFFYLVFFAFVYFAIYKMYAALIQTTDEEHRFAYFAKKYLPRGLSLLAPLIVLGGLVFTLTIYLILAATFAGLVVSIPTLWAITIFWALSSTFIFVRLSLQGLAEFFGAIGIVIIVAIVFGAGGFALPDVPLFKKLNLTLLFLPFGPLLFAFSARIAIPKVVDEYREAKRRGKSFSLGKVIFLGTFIPVIVYAFFVVGTLRLSNDVSPETLNSLGSLPPFLLTALGVMGLLTLWTSYFMIGTNIREVLKDDWGVSGWLSGVIVLSLPLLLYFAGFQNFLAVVSFAGGVFAGLSGIFVVTMWRKAFPAHSLRWVSWPLYAVFLTALTYTFSTHLF